MDTIGTTARAGKNIRTTTEWIASINDAFRGVDYGPFRGNQNPNYGIYPTIAEMEQDLPALKAMGNALRVFSVQNGLDTIVAEATKTYGIEAIPSAYLSNVAQSWAPAANAAEIAALEALLNSSGVDLTKIPFVVVGSEAILSQGFSVDTIVANINAVRAASPAGIKFTTAEVWSNYLSGNAANALGNAVDVIFVNIYPFWENVAIDSAVAYVVQIYQKLTAAYPGKPVVISETGWPSAGSARGAAVPSAANEQRYWHDFLIAAKQNAIPYFGFEAYDEPWKSGSGEGDVGGHWGLYGDNRTAKGALTSFNPWTSGTTGNDTLTGTGSNGAWLEGLAGNDTLTGTSGADVLFGDDGNDVLRGAAGSNTLDGGAGTDTAAFTGRPSDYFITTSAGTSTVIGTGKTDTLTAIERASFDGSGQTLTLAEFQAQSFSPLQALEYIASYSDLMAAFGDDPVWGARHYFNNGLSEGRTIGFSALAYVASYSDLIVAFSDNQMAATEHYLKNGRYEGRTVTFDPLAYVCSYSDLLLAFRNDKTAAAEHFIKNGYWEGRQVSFDPLAYLCSYNDLLIAFHNDKTAAEEHYIRNGFWEGRKVTFNALAYIASYTDLIAAFGDNAIAAEEHYIRNGYWENRKVTFDPVAYLINNSDLGSCGFTASDVSRHYIKNGYWEHRTTNGAFGSEQTGHDLAIGGTASDSIGTSGDKDWFAVAVTAGQTYTFTLSGVDGGNGTLADPFLAICDGHGVRLTYANDSINRDAVIRFTALSTGTCYLVASANDTGTGTYKLLAAAGSG
ncbi:glycosyl hydrolase family 17 protein [Rhizomicrobium electricum]|uniref:Endo-1,3-beta-glucanase btgC n=1 Tax=Rhizomicrobium electricum TaxID=480070 RepID=A0ABN1EMI9_9PROT|nr:glycosyl hydrolase family 17 protein [Rhizomicrobium electricum]NIJ46942.1 exo-beta-1,3-glucanase (GH17 family) [Rhizomicrobium electricum]